MNKIIEKSYYAVVLLFLLFCDLEVVREEKGCETNRYLAETMGKIKDGIPYNYLIPTIGTVLAMFVLLFLFSDFNKKIMRTDGRYFYAVLSSIMFILLSVVCYHINRDLLILVSVFPFIFYVVSCVMSGIKNNPFILFSLFILINVITYFFHKIFMETPVGNLGNSSIMYYMLSILFFWFLIFPFLERSGDK